jgi:1,5-anhydro-D-fructose reductase (1,5-anhydro-D-mannitol-forming)
MDGGLRVKIGVVGVHYGHIGGMLASARASGHELVGLVEADDGLYARTTEDGAIPRFDSVARLLDEARPEVVLEGIAHRGKADLVEVCAAAGAHVLLDKPLCRTLDDWTRIEQAVRTHGTRLSMWFTSRSYPPFLALKEAVDEGLLGDIVSLISTHPHKTSRERAPAWYFDPQEYTGPFHDLACHGVDQVRWLTGAECVGVHALETCRKYTDAPPLTDHVQASFRLSDGALATLTADWVTPQKSPAFGDTRFIVMGTAGSAHLRAYAGDELLLVTDDREPWTPELPPGRGDVFVRDMVAAWDRGDEHVISTADVLAVARACLTAQESARLGGDYLTIPG